MNAVARLLALAGPALVESPPVEETERKLGATALDLFALLRLRNGFYAFDGALHLYPSSAGSAEMTLETWNAPDLWRFEYGDLAEGLLFLGEDVFGGQFCIRGENVCSFDAETGAVEALAVSVEEWAGLVLANHERMTGFPLLRQWQEANGLVPRGSRLVPAVPFVLGGEYAVDNLRATSAVEAMRFRGYLARQIYDLPDGAQVKLQVVD